MQDKYNIHLLLVNIFVSVSQPCQINMPIYMSHQSSFPDFKDLRAFSVFFCLHVLLFVFDYFNLFSCVCTSMLICDLHLSFSWHYMVWVLLIITKIISSDRNIIKKQLCYISIQFYLKTRSGASKTDIWELHRTPIKQNIVYYLNKQQ